MHAAVIVADDLTGAMDTAHGFAARGHGTAVLALPEADRTVGSAVSESSVIGVNTGSRYADPQRAVDAVADALGAVPNETTYKKIDSTLRGNIGAEVDATLAATGAELALVAPAFPAAGRTTTDGVHYVDGIPIAETEYVEDEKGPTSSAIADRFDAVGRAIETVALETVDAGRDAVEAAFRDVLDRHDTAPIVICDAETDDHLATIAAAADGIDALYVGSGGLAAQIDVDDDAPGEPADLERPTGAALGVVGSVNATTLGQLERVPDAAVVELDAVTALTGNGIDEAAARAAERLRAGRPAVVTAATDRDAVDRTNAAGRERGLAAEEIRERVATNLADAAARTVREADPSGLFLTGGDVAVGVMRALDATTIGLTGKSAGTGIPIGRLADGVAAGTPVVTKAGGFGTTATIVNCLDILRRVDE